MLTLTDIKWAAEECKRQNSGELSVADLCNALYFARETGRVIDILDVKLLGKMVEPTKNQNGFRQVPVHFADGLSTALDHRKIETALSSLIRHGEHLTPTEWYKEFETIHPFVDGNGRVGAILFNLKNGTINIPIAPPNVFN